MIAMRGKWEETHPKPFTLFLREHALYNHLRLDRDTGQALKAKPNRTVKLALRLFCEHRISRGHVTSKIDRVPNKCGMDR